MARLLPMLVLMVAVCFIVYSQSAAAAAADAENQSKPEEFKNTLAGKRDAYMNCAAACDYRCSKASLHHRCLKYCNICCGKCQCVPPGTAGNREVCGCYNDMKNSRGGHKCP